MPNIFDILNTYGSEELAIRYAKRIMENNKGKTPTDIAPGTRVYELVEELRKYCPLPDNAGSANDSSKKNR